MAEGLPAPRAADGEWQYQLRVDLADDAAAAAAQAGADHPGLRSLRRILAAHDAELICQYDAFAGYCAEAEARGVEHYPLYAWTKAVIDDPAKKAKYLKSFSIRVGGAEVYARESAGRAGGGAHAARRRRRCEAAREARHRPRQQPADAGEEYRSRS